MRTTIEKPITYLDIPGWPGYRVGDDGSRFYEVLLNVVGKRLTWRQLTAQDDAGFMGIT